MNNKALTMANVNNKPLTKAYKNTLALTKALWDGNYLRVSDNVYDNTKVKIILKMSDCMFDDMMGRFRGV